MHAGDLRPVCSRDRSGGLVARVGVPLADVYLEFLGGRCRPNTVRAAAYDLKVFFTVVAKSPEQVQPADVLAFITAQRTGRAGGRGVLQPVDPGREPGGVSAARCAGACRSCPGFFAFLQARGDVRGEPGAAGAADPAGTLAARVRVSRWCGSPGQLPRILSPGEVDALTAALRTHRDRAMVAAMVLGGLRRCEVLGLRLGDLRVAERRVFIAEGKGGQQRLIPVSGRFFTEVGAYLDDERPPGQVRTGCLWCSRARAAGSRCRLRGWMRSLLRARRRAGLEQAYLPRAAAYLPDPAARSRDGAGGGAGPGRARLDRVDPDLPAPG